MFAVVLCCTTQFPSHSLPLPSPQHTTQHTANCQLQKQTVLPLTKQLSVVSGSLWSKTLQGARAQRIEMLLLHEFHERKFILPDKLTARDRAQQQQQAAAAAAAGKGGGKKGAKKGAKAGGGGAGAGEENEEVRLTWCCCLCWVGVGGHRFMHRLEVLSDRR